VGHAAWWAGNRIVGLNRKCATTLLFLKKQVMQYLHPSTTSWLSGQRLTRLAAFVGLAAALAGPLASCRSEDPAPDLIQPTTAKPSSAPN
jgi:hypothetical protein